MRALAVWFVILVSAFLNGFLREALLSPRLGPATAQVISTIVLILLILAITWFGMPWIAPQSARQALGVGALRGPDLGRMVEAPLFLTDAE